VHAFPGKRRIEGARSVVPAVFAAAALGNTAVGEFDFVTRKAATFPLAAIAAGALFGLRVGHGGPSPDCRANRRTASIGNGKSGREWLAGG
jgi:hypothetical protein